MTFQRLRKEFSRDENKEKVKYEHRKFTHGVEFHLEKYKAIRYEAKQKVKPVKLQKKKQEELPETSIETSIDTIISADTIPEPRKLT